MYKILLLICSINISMFCPPKRNPTVNFDPSIPTAPAIPQTEQAARSAMIHLLRVILEFFKYHTDIQAVLQEIIQAAIANTTTAPALEQAVRTAIGLNTRLTAEDKALILAQMSTLTTATDQALASDNQASANADALAGRRR